MEIDEINRGLSAILPDILMLLLGFVLIGADLFVGEAPARKRALGGLATIGLIGVLGVVGL